MQTLNQLRQKLYVPSRVLQQTFNYLGHAFAWKTLKPHAEAVIRPISSSYGCNVLETSTLIPLSGITESSKRIQFFVNLPEKTITLSAFLSDNIGSIKTKIQEKEGNLSIKSVPFCISS